MQHETSKSPEPDTVEQLHSIVDKMLEPFGKRNPNKKPATILTSHSPPFDISRPNEHVTKAEFLVEVKAVEESVKQFKEIMRHFVPRESETEQKAMLENLKPIIERKMRDQAPRAGDLDVVDLVRKNVADIGGFDATLYVLLDFWTALTGRLDELRDQEARFWKLPHRAPDYYARAIALRLAKLYANETGQRPTYGSSGVSGDPSTSYSRALKQVFEVLGIESGIRSHAEYAVGQISESDLKPIINTLAQMLVPGSKPREPTGILGGLFGLSEESAKD